jgi:hypothetical protein
MRVLLKPEEMVDIEADYPEIDDPFFFQLARRISQVTISDIAAQWALYKAIHHVVKHNIPGDIVECGVWSGGSMLLAAEALRHFGDTTRKIYLYDTFDGMPKPFEQDIDNLGNSARQSWTHWRDNGRSWGFGGTLENVKSVLSHTAFPQDNLICVPGMVKDTKAATLPDQIALLRLDTDFYASTYHELLHGYPKLSPGGVLIVDDYGYFLGARKATDRYIAENALPLFLARLNSSVHLAIKPTA